MPDCTVTAEPLCSCPTPCSYLLRVHPDPGAALGDPYLWGVVVVRDGDCAVFKGATAPWKLSWGRAIEDLLRSLGFRRRRHERRRGGRVDHFDREL